MTRPLLPLRTRISVQTLSGSRTGTITEHLPMCVGGMGYVVALDGGGVTFESRTDATVITDPAQEGQKILAAHRAGLFTRDEVAIELGKLAGIDVRCLFGECPHDERNESR